MAAELSVVTERLPKSQVGMTIEVPAEVVDATYDRVLNRLASRAKIEGFRPGRAPRALVEARIGAAVLREEVVETMVPEVVRQALDDKSIDPIDNPDVEVLELERGRPARLKATISVMPEVTLADVTKLEVEPPDHTHEVTDEMLERRLEDLREPMAEITPVEREVRTGDIAVIDIEVEVDGKIVESETRKATEAEVREGVLLPELIAVLPGSFMDETREANVKFPESYSNPELAGKEATIRVTVRGVKEKLLPALDETLVMSLTGGKQESVEAYRQSVRDELEESARAVAKMDREQAVVKALVDASSVEVPEALVERELTSELESLERSLNRQGLKLDRYLEYLGKTIDEWMAGQRPDAEARLKVDLVLGEYARREGLEPSDEDVVKFLEEQAGTDDELKGQVAELKKSSAARRYFASRLRRIRVLEHLLKNAG
ncbi:MAG: trigger factor [Chloroflexi bacterium]|nr:MAG: trigger factor [Chloroflexota bacterium]TMF73506.1 MAG: trigger factor [Chloroflexota bacterium]TMF78036.1 MAG: trigger factor [Chloroflexota bacterium]TMF92567.1 MAG: trigger factor [Chloroflexota bacterium]